MSPAGTETQMRVRPLRFPDSLLPCAQLWVASCGQTDVVSDAAGRLQGRPGLRGSGGHAASGFAPARLWEQLPVGAAGRRSRGEDRDAGSRSLAHSDGRRSLSDTRDPGGGGHHALAHPRAGRAASALASGLIRTEVGCGKWVFSAVSSGTRV